MRKPARLVDVARQCGLAISTVSEILAHPDGPRYAAETREKVKEAARRLGYRPHAHARALATGKSGIIGVACGWPWDINVAPAIAAAEQVITQHQHQMLLRVSQDLSVWHQLLAHSRVDFLAGLFSSMAVAEQAEWSPALQQHIAYVGDERNRLGESATCYTWSDAQGARMGIEHLIAHGHKNIVVLTGIATPKEPKVHAAIQSLRERSLPVQLVAAQTEEEGLPAGQELAAQALQKYPHATAMWMRTIMLAPGVYDGLRSSGLRIPEDVSLVACYDHQNLLALNPPLTCVHFPLVEATSQAITDYFAGAIASRPRSAHFECRLVERASVKSV